MTHPVNFSARRKTQRSKIKRKCHEFVAQVHDNAHPSALLELYKAAGASMALNVYYDLDEHLQGNISGECRKRGRRQRTAAVPASKRAKGGAGGKIIAEKAAADKAAAEKAPATCTEGQSAEDEDDDEEELLVEDEVDGRGNTGRKNRKRMRRKSDIECDG